MNEQTQRTIDELRARYDLEPSLRDVFVEGDFDKDIADICIREMGQKDRIVYDIDSVFIPAPLLREHGLTDGNKQRVIALARALATTHGGLNYSCIVDRDTDHWLGELEVCPGLVWTKYCSIEAYFLTTESVREVLLDAAKSKINDLQKLFESLVRALRWIYAMRLADQEFGWSMQWLPIQKHVQLNKSEIDFHRSEYTRRLLLKNRRYSKLSDFRSSVTKWETATSGDHRNCARGHDFVELLAWTIRSSNGVKELASAKAIERIFVISAVRVRELLDLFA